MRDANTITHTGVGLAGSGGAGAHEAVGRGQIGAGAVEIERRVCARVGGGGAAKPTNIKQVKQSQTNVCVVVFCFKGSILIFCFALLCFALLCFAFPQSCHVNMKLLLMGRWDDSFSLPAIFPLSPQYTNTPILNVCMYVRVVPCRIIAVTASA